MRLLVGFVFLLAFGTVLASDPAKLTTEQTRASPQQSDNRGSELQPLIVTKPAAEQEHDEQSLSEHAGYELRTTRATEWLTGVTGLLALFTALLWVVNRRLIKETNTAAARQAVDTERAIKEATRSATAMQEVADATRANAVLMSAMFQKQMRAYISVELGNAIYQDDHFRFEAQPVLTNNGLTPAKNVCFQIMAAILDGSEGNPTAPPVNDINRSESGIAPRQSRVIRKVVQDRVSEEDVSSIMVGDTRRLFTWGRITYEDVYGGSWYTNFFMSYSFLKREDNVLVSGNYQSTHNDFS